MRPPRPCGILEGCLPRVRPPCRRRGTPAALTASAASRIRLFGEIAGLDGQDVPDPYGGSAEDFADVLALLESGLANLVAQLSAAKIK